MGSVNESAQSVAEGSSYDAIIELLKKDVDRHALRENLKLTPQQRLDKHRAFAEFLAELRQAKSLALETQE